MTREAIAVFLFFYGYGFFVSILTYNFSCMTLNLTDDNFNDLIRSSDKLCIVDFWAEWCGPCKKLTPIINEISEECKESIVVGEFNIDSSCDIVNDYAIRSVPTLLFFKGGEMVFRQVGFTSKESILNRLDGLK